MWLGTGFGGRFPIAVPDEELIVVVNQWNILPRAPMLLPDKFVERILSGLTDGSNPAGYEQD